MPGEVIPYRFNRHPDGRTASLFGASPGAGFVIVSQGFTVRHPDGTTGLGRPPFATREEAQAWVDAHPTFSGMRG